MILKIKWNDIEIFISRKIVSRKIFNSLFNGDVSILFLRAMVGFLAVVSITKVLS